MSRVLALDIGSVRVGVAVSDPSGIIALPLGCIDLRKERDVAGRIASLCEEYGVSCVVVGLPLQMDARAGAAVRRTRNFTAALKERLPEMKFVEVDERLTSAAAERSMRSLGVKAKDYRKNVDSMAAALILEGYLR